MARKLRITRAPCVIPQAVFASLERDLELDRAALVVYPDDATAKEILAIMRAARAMTPGADAADESEEMPSQRRAP